MVISFCLPMANHTKGRGNWYIITLDGKRLYFAGDTECTPEMKAIRSIEVAFVPMNIHALYDDAGRSGRLRKGHPAENRVPVSL